MTLWSEPSEDRKSAATAYTGKAWTTTHFGTLVFSKVRRFIVVKEGTKECIAVPVTTYGGQGVAKKGVTKGEHAIVHFSKKPPPPTRNEEPERGEAPMLDPIRVDPDEKNTPLDEMSRVSMAQPHCIQHNLRVKSIGKVNTKSMPSLINQFRSVTVGDMNWGELPQAPAEVVPSTPSDIEGLLQDRQLRSVYDNVSALAGSDYAAEVVSRCAAAQTTDLTSSVGGEQDFEDDRM